jgi:hypothetical protein
MIITLELVLIIMFIMTRVGKINGHFFVVVPSSIDENNWMRVAS